MTLALRGFGLATMTAGLIAFSQPGFCTRP